MDIGRSRKLVGTACFTIYFTVGRQEGDTSKKRKRRLKYSI